MKEVESEVVDLNTINEKLNAVIEAQSLAAISLMRIYDLLASQYGETNAQDAVELVELHKAGGLRSEIPWLNLPAPDNG